MVVSRRRVSPMAALVAAVMAAASMTIPGARAQGTAPPRKVSPPGQIKVITVNAKQHKVLGLKRFIALFELGRALRDRPAAFDGGFRGAVAAPDVVILQEVRASNFEIFERLMKQRWKYRYRMYGLPNAAGQLLINIDRIEPLGDPVTWDDVCIAPDSRKPRTYQYGRFRLIETGDEFAVAGIHILKNYVETGKVNCFPDNIAKLRAILDEEPRPVIVGGDFNKRASSVPYECDPEETAEPFDWWKQMTAPQDGGRAYLDAVRWWNRSRGRSLATQWTHEQARPRAYCDDDRPPGLRRTRIDYLFASGLTVADAYADSPGWAGQLPGQKSDLFKYSDHRFVQGRFSFADLSRPAPVALSQQRGGRIEVTWPATHTATATSLMLYRSIGNRPYDALQRLSVAETSFVDSFTQHGRRYRYALAAVDPESRQSVESRGSWMEADAVGPEVTYVRPVRSASSVPIYAGLEAHFDDFVARDSVTRSTISLYRVDNGRRVRGTVRQSRPRHLVFKPEGPLVKGIAYRVVVAGHRDHLGNRGPRESWRFRTVEPPPKKRRGRR